MGRFALCALVCLALAACGDSTELDLKGRWECLPPSHSPAGSTSSYLTYDFENNKIISEYGQGERQETPFSNLKKLDENTIEITVNAPNQLRVSGKIQLDGKNGLRILDADGLLIMQCKRIN